jgi:hypothetical protein
MVNEKIKKILIFACPRAGTTVIQNAIAVDLFRIPNLVEPFNSPALGFNPANPKIINGKPADLYTWTQEQRIGVMKLLAINLEYIEIDRLLSMGNFDRVVIIKRKNLVDCCVSLCMAQQTSKYHYYERESINPFYCDLKEVDYWITMYRRCLIALNQITNSNVPYDIIFYEDFMNDQIQYIEDVPLQKSKTSDNKLLSLNLPYSELCTNYREVEEKIKKELC